jgi:hypothetical protein
VDLVIFYAVVIFVDGLLHFYLWKRLVRDTLRGRWPRRIGAAVAILLAVLLPATMIASRTGRIGELAWFGFLWLALMFYLFVLLLILEVPRLVIAIVRRLKRRTGNVVDAALKAPMTVPAGDAGTRREPTTQLARPNPGESWQIGPPPIKPTRSTSTAQPAEGARSGQRTQPAPQARPVPQAQSPQ